MDLWNLKLVSLELIDQFGGVKLAVASSSLDDLRLLIQCEVLPREVWSNVLLEEAEDLIVGDSTWIGEIVDTGILVLGQEDRSWEEIMENCIRVGYVDDTLILRNLGNEVTGMQVVADGHTKSEDESVVVKFHDLLNI